MDRVLIYLIFMYIPKYEIDENPVHVDDFKF